jgi:hypothetical protein
MIIEDDRGKYVGCTYYDLMGVAVQVNRREERVARFIGSYYAIRNNDAYDELQHDIIEEWWKWRGEQK